MGSWDEVAAGRGQARWGWWERDDVGGAGGAVRARSDR